MNPEDWVDKIEELSAVAQDARDVLAELRSELREARKVIREMREMRDGLLKELVEERIGEAVKAGLDDYSDTLRKAMDQAIAHVDSEINKLFTTYMKGSRSSQLDLRDLMRGQG